VAKIVKQLAEHAGLDPVEFSGHQAQETAGASTCSESMPGRHLFEMAVRLSIHIQREMPGRGITMAYIETVLASPTYTALDPVDPHLTRSFGPIPGFGNRMLRVVHRPDGNDVFVVTATWDRGAARR
jgi:hypothetical protein